MIIKVVFLYFKTVNFEWIQEILKIQWIGKEIIIDKSDGEHVYLKATFSR